MSHIIHVQLGEGFTDGFFVIQPDWNVREFRQLIHDKLAPELHEPYLAVYRKFYRNSNTIFCDNGGPWVIVVISSSPWLIRRRALQEIVQLAKAITHTEEMRTRFIDRVYAAVRIPGDDDEAR